MAIKLRRTLYIGLGGTGMGTLLNVKKMFMDNYGEVPPMIGFLGIDTDGGAYRKTLKSRAGLVSLSPNEQLPIQVQDARSIYDVYKSHFAWLPEQNLKALTSMTLGAGQVRTNGRFAFVQNYQSVEKKLNDLINVISNASIMTNDRYELLASEVEVHMVFSVCGGTGCGTFLDAAYLVRRCAPQCKLTGYAVLPSVFEAMANSGMAKVKPNAYGAIQDLDFLMHMDMGKTPIDFDYINSSYTIRERPFNSFYFIDNKNANGDTYLHVDQLQEMISLALVTSAGELSAAAASVSDNLEKNIREGTMNIQDKQAWAAGLGICEILFRGEDLQRIYALKAVKRMVAGLTNSCVDATSIVDAWIDSSEVHIRENNGNDQVIDFMCDKAPRFPLSSIEDKDNAKPETDQYLERAARPADKDIQDKIEELTTRVNAELHALMVREINRDCGVGTALEVLKGIGAQVEVFLGEMNSELDEAREQEPRQRNAIDLAVQDLQEYNAKFFKTKSRLSEKEDDLVAAVNALAINIREQVRRQAAITFYNNLKQTLAAETEHVDQVRKALVAVVAICDKDLAELSNAVARPCQTFQIDLAQGYASQVEVADCDVMPQDFIRPLHGQKVYDFAEKTPDELKALIEHYCEKMNGAEVWGAKTIDDVIDALDDNQFTRLVEDAIKRSSTLLRIDPHGYKSAEQPSDFYYVGVPNKDTNRMRRGDFFKSKLTGTVNVDFASIGMDDRIIVFRQLGVVPAYAVASVPTFEEKYRQANCNCHFDAKLLNRMQREEYSLMPKKCNDDSLELWVKGFIFGLIKHGGNKYYYKNEKEGDILDDYWTELAEYREDAYDQFRRNKTAIHDQYEKYFDEQETQRGAEYLRQLLSDVKADYLGRFSQLNLTREQLKNKAYEGTSALIREELNYVKNQLQD